MLTDKQKTAAILWIKNKMSYRKIAEKLGISHQAVADRLKRFWKNFGKV